MMKQFILGEYFVELIPVIMFNPHVSSEFGLGYILQNVFLE